MEIKKIPIKFYVFLGNTIKPKKLLYCHIFLSFEYYKRLLITMILVLSYKRFQEIKKHIFLAINEN